MEINAESESSQSGGTRVSGIKMVGERQTIKTTEPGSQITKSLIKGKDQTIEIGESSEVKRPENPESAEQRCRH